MTERIELGIGGRAYSESARSESYKLHQQLEHCFKLVELIQAPFWGSSDSRSRQRHHRDLDEEKLERYVRELVMSLTGKKMEFKQ